MCWYLILFQQSLNFDIKLPTQELILYNIVNANSSNVYYSQCSNAMIEMSEKYQFSFYFCSRKVTVHHFMKRYTACQKSVNWRNWSRSKCLLHQECRSQKWIPIIGTSWGRTRANVKLVGQLPDAQLSLFLLFLSVSFWVDKIIKFSSAY